MRTYYHVTSKIYTIFENLSRNLMRVAGGWRARPNISYRQADLHELDPASGYDFILSVLTLHYVPDLHAALRHIKELINPGGRVALLDIYPARPRAIPRWQLQANSVRLLALNVFHRGPAAAPGCQLQRVGGRWGVAVIWDAPLPPGGPG